MIERLQKRFLRRLYFTAHKALPINIRTVDLLDEFKIVQLHRDLWRGLQIITRIYKLVGGLADDVELLGGRNIYVSSV